MCNILKSVDQDQWASEDLSYFCHLLIVFENTLSIYSSTHTNRVSNSLDPGQHLQVVGPDLGTNCL